MQPPPPRPDQPDAFERPEPTQPSWRAVEAVPVFFIAVIVTFVAHVVLMQIPRFCGGQAVIETFLGEIAFGAAVVVWIRYVHRGNLAALGVPTRPWGDIGIGLLVGVGLVFAGALTLGAVREVVTLITGKAPEQPEQLVACVRGTWLTLMAPIVVLIAPLGEETFFRGFLYKGLRRRLPVWGAALASGAVFGIVHVFPLLIAPLFIVGVGLAFLYERRQSLLAPMAAHAAFNLVGFVMIALSRR